MKLAVVTAILDDKGEHLLPANQGRVSVIRFGVELSSKAFHTGKRSGELMSVKFDSIIVVYFEKIANEKSSNL